MNKLLVVSFFITILFAACRKNDPRPATSVPSSWQTNNTPPTRPLANAGRDTTIHFPNNSVPLSGQLSGGAPFQVQWRKLTNEPSYWITSPASLNTTAFFTVSGVYYFELRLTNVGGTSLDTVKVTVVDFSFCTNNRPEKIAQLVPIADLPGEPLSNDLAASGNKLFVLKQYFTPDPSFNSNLVRIVDLTTNSSTTAPLSANRGALTMIAAGDKVFFAGGASGVYDPPTDIFYATVDIYNTTTNTWTTAQLSEPRAYCKATVVGNKVFFAGGLKQNLTTSKRVDIYDLATNTWSSTNLPGSARVVQAAVGTSNKLYLCGGYSGYMDVNGFGYYFVDPVQEIDIYNVITGQWTKDSMQYTKSNFSGIAYNDKVYLAGGEINGLDTRHVEVIDANTNSHSYSCLNQGISYPQFGPTATVRNGQIVYAGYLSSSFSSFDIFEPSTNTWSVGKIVSGMDNEPWSICTILSVNNQLYLASTTKLYKLNF